MVIQERESVNSCRLDVPVDVDFLPVVGSFLGSLADCYGVSPDTRASFQEVIVRLVKLIMDRGFAPGDLASIAISVIPITAGLQIVIEDRGLPFDPDKWTAGEAGEILEQVRRHMDVVRFLNLGPEGHRTRLVKYFQRLRPEVEHGGASAPPDGASPLEIRRLAPGEALQVCRCVYRCYGYSYGALDAAYFPERMEALSASNEILSVVAVTPTGEVAGHLALERSGANAKLATAGVAAVLPEFRSRGLAHKLTIALLKEAESQGVEEAQAFAVTSHPYSQKLAHSYGFHCLAVYLATAYFDFKGIREQGGQRETILGLYRRLSGTVSEPEVLYAPTRHRVMIESLCLHIERPVRFVEVDSPRIPEGVPEGVPSVLFHESPIRNLAKIHISRFGEGWLEQVRSHVRYLRQQEYRQFILTLPLGTPFAVVATPALEKLGFFFAGLSVREEGLCLVLQFLHGVTLDYAQIELVEPMAKELLAYVKVLDPGRI